MKQNVRQLTPAEYTVLLGIVLAIYSVVKLYFPDFPVSETAFQTLVFYLLVKIAPVSLPVVDSLILKLSPKPEPALKSKKSK